jgi:hypothetical protein
VLLLGVVLVVISFFAWMYLTKEIPATDAMPGDWCGTALGDGPDGVDAVLRVSFGTTSRFMLMFRPSMESCLEDTLVQRGCLGTIRPWANVAGSNDGYAFFKKDGVPESSLTCRFSLSMVGPLTFTPVAIDKPTSLHDLLPFRYEECPIGTECGMGMKYRLLGQPSMAHIPQWYGVYKDGTTSAAINFRGPDFSQYTLVIGYREDVQLCHGLRTDLPGMEQVFEGAGMPTHVNISVLMGRLPICPVFIHVPTDELPLPISTTSKVSSFLETDRILRALLSRPGINALSSVLAGRRIEYRVLDL